MPSNDPDHVELTPQQCVDALEFASSQKNISTFDVLHTTIQERSIQLVTHATGAKGRKCIVLQTMPIDI